MAALWVVVPRVYVPARIPSPILLGRPGRRPGRRGFGDYSAVAQQISQIEVSNPVGAACNNPGNLTYAGQPGAVPTVLGSYTWACFPTYSQGWQALLNQIALDASRGLTIAQFTAKYAPAAAGNDPAGYAQRIASAVGLSPDDLLSLADSAPAVAASSADLSSAFSFLDPTAGASSDAFSFLAPAAGAATSSAVDPLTVGALLAGGLLLGYLLS